MQDRPISFHRALWEEVFHNDARAVCIKKVFSQNGVPQPIMEAALWDAMADAAAAKHPKKGDKMQVLEKVVATIMMQDTGNLVRQGHIHVSKRVGPPVRGRKVPSLVYDIVDAEWIQIMGLPAAEHAKKPPWRAPSDGKEFALTPLQQETVDHWFMLDHNKGDSIKTGITEIQARLNKKDEAYAPFGDEFPMLLITELFNEYPRDLFSDLFIGDKVLAQGVEATAKEAAARLEETFLGVYEPQIGMTLETCFKREVFDRTPTAHQGRDVRVLGPALVAALDLLLRAAFSGQTLSAKFGSSQEIEEEHIRRETFFQTHWRRWRKMWVAFYVARAAVTEAPDKPGSCSTCKHVYQHVISSMNMQLYMLTCIFAR